MTKLKTILLVLCLIISGAWCFSSNDLTKNTLTDGTHITVISQSQNHGTDRSSYISASIDGHTLSVAFSSNIGEVSIKILDESYSIVDCIAIDTPNGYLFYIPLAGRYIVVFEFPDGDEYYGDFEVTD